MTEFLDGLPEPDGTMPDDAFFSAAPESEGRTAQISAQAGTATLVRLSDVTAQPVRWLWAGWIAIGKIAIVDGDPGLGKSLLTLDIAARVSRGATMPGGSPGALIGEPAGVVLLTAEDDPADTLRPRLDAAGADATRIVALTGVRGEDGGDRMPRLGDLEAIREAITSVGARLVVIDPVMAYLGGDAHRDNEVRQSLGPIAALASELGVAVLVVRHLNKSGGTHAVYRGGGSIAIIGAARTGMLVAKDPEDETARVLAAIKSNIGELPESLGYRVTASGDVARVEWTGPSHHGAGALLGPADGPEDSSVTDDAAEWLRGELADGPRRVSEIKSAGQRSGLAWRTLERAKQALNLKAKRVNDGGERGTGAWAWATPGDARPFKTASDVQGRHGGLEDSLKISTEVVQDRQTPALGGLERSEAE